VPRLPRPLAPLLPMSLLPMSLLRMSLLPMSLVLLVLAAALAGAPAAAAAGPAATTPQPPAPTTPAPPPAPTPGSPAGPLVDPGTGTAYSLDRVVVPMVFPVAGKVSWTDDFLVCRSGCGRMHMGQDLMGAKMTPLVAAFDGVVTSLKRETAVGQGNYVVISADRGPAAGWSALYVHVNNDTPGTDDGRGTAQWAFPAGLGVGSRVLAGQLVGWLGDSGNAEDTAPHLHFELRRGSGRGGVVHNPHPTLLAARRLAAPLPSGPHPEGSLVRHPSGALFVLEGGRKRAVSDAVLAAAGRSAAAAVPVTAAESMGYPTAAPAVLRDGTVARDRRGTTWLVTGGARAKAPLPALAALGRRSPRLVQVLDVDLARLPVAPALPRTPYFPGALVRVDGQQVVHAVGPDGRARPVPHAAVMSSHGWTSQDVSVVAPTVAAARAPRADPPVGLRDGTLVQTPSHVVAVVAGGKVRRLHDARQLAAYGYRGLPRLAVPDALLAGLPAAELTAR
jgi:murein DD-endopeptidase MepM/ murein hydrolase activator NlpD